MASNAPAVKAALKALLTSAFAADPAVGVSYGHPGPDPRDDLIAVMGVTGEQEPGPMRPNPLREERLRATVIVSCFVGGGPEAQQPATDRAYALLAAIETALRGDLTLGGLVRRADLVEHELVEDESEPPATPGRIAEISAVIATEARV